VRKRISPRTVSFGLSSEVGSTGFPEGGGAAFAAPVTRGSAAVADSTSKNSRRFMVASLSFAGAGIETGITNNLNAITMPRRRNIVLRRQNR
jgi:hypothetical protein